MKVRRYAPIAAVPVAAVLGVGALLVARANPFGSFAGHTTAGAVAELGGGWALAAVGVLYSFRHPANRFGYLIIAAGVAWFLPELANPNVGSSLAFTLGLIGFSGCVAFVAHAALAYPTGRLRSILARATVATLYAGTLLLLGLLTAVIFDPAATGCGECPSNLVLVRGNESLFDAFNRYGLWITLAAVAATGALLLWRLASSRTIATVLVPVFLPAGAYLGLVAWDLQHSLARGIPSNDSFDQYAWRFEAIALTALAAGIGWGLVREGRARSTIAGMVVELSRSAATSVRDALADTLGDPDLALAYRTTQGAYVDASGWPVELRHDPGRAVTPILAGEDTVAVLTHEERVLEQPGLLQQVLSGARVAIENERLQAEVRAHLLDLQASRARIVAVADTERRRLERDLHDGAQQRVLAFAYDLRIARAGAERAGDASVAELLSAAGEEAQTALEELWRVAHGIYPAVLAEAGLGPALATLAAEAPIAVEFAQPPRERYPDAVEAAAYFAIVAGIDDAAARGASFAAIDVARSGDRLRLDLSDDGAPRTAPLVHVADRIGALGGVMRAGSRTLRAEIPCA